MRSPWDYHHKHQEWLAWLHSVVEPAYNHSPPQLTFLPDFPTMIWNTNKKYMLDLTSRGVPIVPTKLIEQNQQIDYALIQQIADSEGWKSRELLVAKPVVGANGEGVMLLSLDEAKS